jgi:leader peptidase (prepilin peptidase)/N-methyltransferase
MMMAYLVGIGLICLSIVDSRRQLIPDSILIPLALIAIVNAPLPQGIGIGPSILGAVSTAALFYGIAMLGSALFKKEAMGGGDIKMGAMLGAFLGWQIGLILLPLSALLALAYLAIKWLFWKRSHDVNVIAFGPFLATSGLILILYGNALLEFYLQLML